MQMGFYFDQSRCTGCYTCVTACEDWNNVPPGPAFWRRVTTIERGKFPNIFVAFLSSSCNHCARPSCAEACPADAINKRSEDGIVLVDQEKCLGYDVCGGLCRDACPYQSPQFGNESNAKMQMCNFCIDRLAENKEPICVGACPTCALDAGPLDELTVKYRNIKEAEGFPYSPRTHPSVVFKIKSQVSLVSSPL